MRFKMAKVNIKFKLKNVKGTWLSVLREKRDEDGKANGYGMTVIVKKDHPQYKEVQRLQLQVLKEAHGESALKKRGKYRLPIRNGDADEDHDDYKEGKEYKGAIYFSANSKNNTASGGSRKPGIVNRRGKIATDEDMEEFLYSGAFFNLSLSFYDFPKPKSGGKPGVACGLNNLMLWQKGDRLDGSVAASDDFAELAEELSDEIDDFEDIDELDDEWGDDIPF